MTAPAPDAPRFLALVGPPDRSWWRALAVLALGGVAAAAAFVLVMAAALAAGLLAFADQMGGSFAAALKAVTEAEADRPLATFLVELTTLGLSLFAGALAFLLVAAKIMGRPLRSFLTSAPRFRWRAVAGGFLVTAPLMIGVIALQLWLESPETAGPLLRAGEPPDVRLIYAAAALVFLFLAALAEEAVFRGWGLQQLHALTGRVVLALIVSGFVFSLVHGDPNPDAFLIRAAMGVAWGWIVLRTGGVEWAAGAHLANNLMICLLYEPLLFKAPERVPFDLAGVLMLVLVLGFLVAVVEAGRSRPALGRWLGVSA